MRSARPRRPTPRAATLAATAAVLVLAAVAAACTPVGPPITVPPGGDDAFTVVLVGDSEPRMRGNTDAELAAYVDNLVSYRHDRQAYFSYGDGTHRISPELVVLAGDISADRDTSVAKDMPIWQRLYDDGIGFVAGFGNHDWDPATFSDGSAGYSLAGHLSNEDTKAFTRETYRRTAQLTGSFTYTEVPPPVPFGPVTFAANYRGVDLVNFNTFLYQPSYTYPEGWPFTCNLGQGGAGCQTFVSAEPQIARMDALLRPDTARTALFVQHYPLDATSWWSDHGASGTTTAQRQDRLLQMMGRYSNVALLAGHQHFAYERDFQVGDRSIRQYVAPYFGGDGGDDTSRGGGFTALLVSPTRGILEARTIPGGLPTAG